jgi:hypothetical protein
MLSPTLSQCSSPGSYLNSEQVLEMIGKACPVSEYGGKKVLLIVSPVGNFDR